MAELSAQRVDFVCVRSWHAIVGKMARESTLVKMLVGLPFRMRECCASMVRVHFSSTADAALMGRVARRNEPLSDLEYWQSFYA